MTGQVDIDTVYVSMGYPQGEEHDMLVSRMDSMQRMLRQSEPLVYTLELLADAHYQICCLANDGNDPEKGVSLDSFIGWIGQYRDTMLYQLQCRLTTNRKTICEWTDDETGDDMVQHETEYHYEVIRGVVTQGYVKFVGVETVNVATEEATRYYFKVTLVK